MGENPTFETLKAADSGRRLVSQSGRHEVAAKVMTDDEGEAYLVLRAWVGSHPGPKSSAGWSEPSRWQHIVLDDGLDIVATGWGKRERDSFAMAQKALAAKGIVAHVREPDTSAAASSPSDKFIWQDGDVDIFTPEEAAERFGWSTDTASE
jgi:hypothetical protein